MEHRIIRLGDKNTKNGTVISAASNHTIEGRAVACVGDMVDCPEDGHGVNPIVEGAETMTIAGRKVAFHHHRSQCGCPLISSMH